MGPGSRLLAIAGIAAAGAFALAGSAAAQQDVYRGKTIRVIIGYGPGGGYDSYARLLIKHMARHVPGNPTVVAQNMPGAGSMTAANHLYNNAPRDGTVFGTFARGLPLAAIVDRANRQIRFKPEKFTWIGSSSSYREDAYLLLARTQSGIRSIEDIRGAGAKQMVLAATNAGAASYDVPVQLLEILGLNLKIIHGYPDGAAMSLAVERGEVDGRTMGLSSVQATQPEWLAGAGFMRPLLQFGRRTRHPAVKDTPTARELAQGAEDMALIELLEMPFFLARPYAAPPEVPAERAAILMKAFLATHKDRDYLADARKQRMDVSPIDGSEIRDMLERMAAVSPEVIQRYLAIAAKTKPEGGGPVE